MLWPLLAATLGTVGAASWRKSQVINSSSTDPHPAISPAITEGEAARLRESTCKQPLPACSFHTCSACAHIRCTAYTWTPGIGGHTDSRSPPLPSEAAANTPRLCCSRSRASRGRALWFTPGDTGPTWKGCDQARADCFYHTLHRLLNFLRSWFFILICILKIREF